MTTTKWFMLVFMLAMVLSTIVESYNYLLMFGFLLIGTKLNEIHEFLKQK